MDRILTLGRLASLGLALVAAPSRGGEIEDPSPWVLAWHDEFDGQALDGARWDHDIGNGYYSYDANQWISGWGNGELQYYTREPSNAFVEGGRLHLRAHKESLHGCGYTSARLKTRRNDGTALFNQMYGRFEFRALLPTGQGLWPALWMMPQDDTYGPWAASGEIDIMEARGQEPRAVFGAVHFGARWPAHTQASWEYKLPDEQTIGEFHVYAIEWEPGVIRWSVDGHTCATQSFWWSSSQTDGSKGVRPGREADLNPWPAPFDRPFYIIINLAVGGNFAGNPDRHTRFPAEMLVDYVRVYRKKAGEGPLPARGKGELPFHAGN